MANTIAPEGYLYVCDACGKTSEDHYGMEGKHSRGWDESCMLNAQLVSIDRLIYSDDKVVEIKRRDVNASS